MMFDIYTQEVKLKDSKGNEFTYELRPLTGRYLPKLYGLMKKLGTEDKIDASKLDEETMSKLHELAFETIKNSYPKEDTNKLDMWVSQNLLQLVEPILKVNISYSNEGVEDEGPTGTR